MTDKTVVISQSMYFPWCGLLDQIRLTDIFVHYDDVQFARGFFNRVQVKTPQGTTLITVPLKNKHQGQTIDESIISYESDWVKQHRSVLLNSYRKTNHIETALALFDEVHDKTHGQLGELGRSSIRTLSRHFSLDQHVEFLQSSELNIQGKSSQRLLDIVKAVEGKIYLTGHGALRYLDHELFETNGVEVRYISYSIKPYQQVFGAFTPFVTALDSVAHLGAESKSILNSFTINWRHAIERSDKL